MEKEIAELQNKLNEFIEERMASGKGKPSAEDLEGNAVYIELHNLIKKQAGEQLEGGCMKFIFRKKNRWCNRMALLGGSAFCSLHQEGEVVVAADTAPSQHQEEEEEEEATAEHERPDHPPSKKRRHLKRMLNPFLIREIEETPEWKRIFKDLSLPLCLDIGCAKGGYISRLRNSVNKHEGAKESSSYSLAWQDKNWNFLGVELYAPLVDGALSTYDRSNKDLHYLHANINMSLEKLEIPNLSRVCLMFPDPWSCETEIELTREGEGQDEHSTKKKNQKNKKRRVMSPEFARRLAKLMKEGSDFYFASDWLDLALDIRHCLMDTGCFSLPLSEVLEAEESKSVPGAVKVLEWPYVPTIKAKDLALLQPGKVEETLIDIKKNYSKPAIISNPSATASSSPSNSSNGKDSKSVKSDEDLLWLEGIPFNGIQTERDAVCDEQWRRVYRLVLMRNKVIV